MSVCVYNIYKNGVGFPVLFQTKFLILYLVHIFIPGILIYTNMFSGTHFLIICKQFIYSIPLCWPLLLFFSILIVLLLKSFREHPLVKSLHILVIIFVTINLYRVKN